VNLSVFLVLGLVSIPSELATHQPTHPVEPPQEFVLQAGGWEVEVRLDRPVELPKALAGQQVTLHLRPTRLFDHEGLRFRYPQQYKFACDNSEKGGESVTLSGSVNVLQLRIFPYGNDLSALLDAEARVIAEEASPQAVIRACELVVKEGRRLAGKHLEAGTSGARAMHEVYALSTGPDAALLMVHGTLGEDGKLDPETARLLELLADSLDWPK